MKEFYGRHKNVILVALIFFIVCAVFGRMLINEFVYDDTSLIVSNRLIKTNLNPLFYFTHGDTLRPDQPLSKDIYRPLATWFFAIEYHLFGPSPFYFHLLSLLLHALNSVLCFFLFKKLTRNSAFSFWGALIFGLHPITTETVAWANQQAALWSWLFSFLALLAFFYENRFSQSWVKITVISASSFFAVFSKEQAVILPILCGLLVFCSGERLKNRLKEIAGVTIPITIYLLFRAIFLGAFSQQEAWANGHWGIFLTMIRGFAEYFKLMVWPHPLSVNYDSFPISETFWDFKVIISAAILAALAALAIIFWRKSKLFSTGIIWIFAVLAPVSNFILPTKQIISERYLYFALPGLILSFFAAADFTFKKINLNRKILIPVSIIFALIISSIFSLGTFFRLADWKNELSLWKHEVEIKPNDWRTQKNYAYTLEKENHTAEAIRYYQKSIELAGGADLYLRSTNALAIAYIRLNETEKAESLLLSALKIFPENNALLYSLGQTYLKAKKNKEAANVFWNLSIKNNNEEVAAFFALLSEKIAGQNSKAKAETENFKNEYFRTNALNLAAGREKFLEGKFAEASSLLTESLQNYPPPIIEPYLWLAEVFEKTNETEKALWLYHQALVFDAFSIDALQGIKRLTSE